MKRVFLFLTFGVLVLSTAASCRADSVRRNIPDQFADPLLWSHYIFRAEVLEVKKEILPKGEWAEGSGGRFHVVELRVIEILKGPDAGPNRRITLMYGMDSRFLDPMEVGWEVIVCVFYKDRVRGGVYSFNTQNDVWVRESDVWVRQPWDFDPPESVVKLSLDEIKTRIASTMPDSVTSNADLVAKAVVVDKSIGQISDNNGNSRETEIYTVKLLSVLKGDNAAGSVVSFTVVQGGQFYPSWRTRVPAEIRPGDIWYVFLKHDPDVGYIPVLGMNGLLQVEDDRLIYDNAVEYHYKPDELEKTVREEVEM